MGALILKVCLDKGIHSYKDFKRILGLPEPLTAKEKQELKAEVALSWVLSKVMDFVHSGAEKEKGPYVVTMVTV